MAGRQQNVSSGPFVFLCTDRRSDPAHHPPAFQGVHHADDRSQVGHRTVAFDAATATRTHLTLECSSVLPDFVLPDG